MIGEEVLNRKISMVKNAIKEIESGSSVDLNTIKDWVQYVESVDVEYLDEERKIKAPERPGKKLEYRGEPLPGYRWD